MRTLPSPARRRPPRLLESVADGAIATVAMSVVMLGADRVAGMMGEQPPTAVTRAALEKAGVAEPTRMAESVAPLAHLAFGAIGGVLYRSLRSRFRRAPGPLLGAGFGLAVWALSYGGWIPAAGILPRPEDDRPGRPTAMIGAHLIYGAVLGTLDDWRRSNEPPEIADSPAVG